MKLEEQEALKPITRCAKITVDVAHKEKNMFFAQIKTLEAQVCTVWL